MKLFSFIVLFFLSKEALCFNNCGDDSWIPFKDEKCYKLIQNVFVNRESAETLCKGQRSESADSNETYVPTVAEVHSSDEQMVLQNYVYGLPDVIQPIWLRATRKSGTTFAWNDRTDVNWGNWEPNTPSNDEGLKDCVAMQSGLTRNEDSNHKINTKNEKVKRTGKQHDILDIDIEDDTVEVMTGSHIQPGAGLWRDVNCKAPNLVVCQKFQTWSVPKIQTTLMEIRSNLAYEISKQIPVGFIYVQLPRKESPQNLWPNFEWRDVSDEYAGLFFRVQGGNAAPFLENQSEGGRLKSVATVSVAAGEWVNSADIPGNDNPSPLIFSGSYVEGYGQYANTFTVSAGEVRPTNTATIVWQRIE